MSYFNDINSFYTFLREGTLDNKFKLRQQQGDKISQTDASAKFGEQIKKLYVEKMCSGEQIIKGLIDYATPDSKNFDAEFAKDLGFVFNTFYQKAGQLKAEVLNNKDYWQYLDGDGDVPKLTPLEGDFYARLCGADPPPGGGGGPPIDLTVNLLRSPKLNPKGRNVKSVDLFMNAIPSLFASQMVPYFEVEFEFPRIPDGAKRGETSIRFLNRPSLLRFLLGSEIDVTKMPLTAADLAMIAPFKTKKKGDDGRYLTSVFAGTEMFTSPQTLINMDTLSGPNTVRLNPAQPFLPPATLTNGSIRMVNAGAGTFAMTYADVEFKVHDRARFAEFSEFLRQDKYTKDITTWITYGWLAPRSRGSEDVYAQFINENMLVKRAFSLMNSSFSFDPTGQVTVKLGLVTQGGSSIVNEPLQSLASDLKGKDVMSQYHRDLKRIRNKISKARKYFGQPNEGTKDIRMYQVLDAAAGGAVEFGLKPEELAEISDNMKVAIEAKDNGLSDNERAEALKAVEAIRALASEENWNKVKNLASSYVQEKLKSCSDGSSPDPFIPLPDKFFNKGAEKIPFYSNDLVRSTYERIPPIPDKKDRLPKKPDMSKVPTAENNPEGGVKQLSQEELDKKKPEQAAVPIVTLESLKISGDLTGSLGLSSPVTPIKSPSKSAQGKNVAAKESTAPTTFQRRIVSLGKLFCALCLPAILGAAKEEGITEVQINFYQFNESCGPLSLHNIAEFPIDFDSFIDQFGFYCLKRGGDVITLNEFMEFISTYVISDKRAPGYGMKTYYNAWNRDSPEPVAWNGDAKEFESKMAKWFLKYKEWKLPALTIAVDCMKAGEDPASRSDLLLSLASTVAPVNSGPNVNIGKVKRIHIFDDSLEQYSLLKQNLIKQEDGSYVVYGTDQEKQAYLDWRQSQQSTATMEGKTAKLPGGLAIVTGGKDALLQLVQSIIPTIDFATNGTMISNATLASKVDGVAGSMAMLGTTFKVDTQPSPNGLTMAENNLPMRFLPAQLTMNSMGCPIAELYQEFFVNFGTGTSIDTTYRVTQIVHNFSPGKFDTSWTFGYSDGYGKFYGAETMGDLMKQVAGSTNPGTTPTDTSSNEPPEIFTEQRQSKQNKIPPNGK
jgi:hypothetical protein